MTSFDEFWAAYPVKQNKKKCRVKWERYIPESIKQDIIDHVLERKVKDRQWLEGYVHYPYTFLNGELWEDEYECIPEPKPVKKAPGICSDCHSSMVSAHHFEQCVQNQTLRVVK